MDTAQLAGEPDEVTLAGETFPVRLLTIGEWGPLQAWIKRHSPSPLTRAALAIQQAADEGTPLDPATQQAMLDHAQVLALSWPPRLGSKAWFESINSLEGGQAQFIHTVLHLTMPDFSMARAEALAPKLSNGDWDELLRVCFYGLPPAVKKKAVTLAAGEAPGQPSKTATTGGRRSSPR